MALFFLKTTAPHQLKDAPGGTAYLTDGRAHARLRGKEVFAERCARCHSSKLPRSAQGLDPHGCAGQGYLDCWNKYWAWTKTDEFKREMREIVLADDFLDDNYLSTELRVPVTLLQTNACSPLATNAIAGQHLGQLLLAVLQGPAVGRHDHGPPSAHRRDSHLSDAGRRPRLHAPPVARQPLVHGAVPLNNSVGQVRSESLRRRAHAVVPGLDRADAVAGETGQRSRPGR